MTTQAVQVETYRRYLDEIQKHLEQASRTSDNPELHRDLELVKVLSDGFVTTTQVINAVSDVIPQNAAKGDLPFSGNRDWVDDPRYLTPFHRLFAIYLPQQL